MIYGMDIRQNKALLVVLLFFVLVSCNSPEKELYSLFGYSFLCESSVVYNEERFVPFIGDGYKYVQYYVPEKMMDRIKKNQVLLIREKGFTIIKSPLYLRSKFQINLDGIIQKGLLFTKKGEDDSNETFDEYIIVDYDNNTIHCFISY